MIVGYIVMCLVFGTTFLAIKMGLDAGMPPFFFAALRFLIAGLLILLFQAWRKQLTRLTAREYIDIAIDGFLMTTVPFAALFWAEVYIPSGTAALLVATAPIFTTIVGVYAGQMRLYRVLIIGMMISAGGIILIVGTGQESIQYGWVSYMSKASIVAAELFFAIGAVRSKKRMNRVAPQVFNGLQMTFASIGLLVLSWIFEDAANTSYSLTTVGPLLYLAIVASIVASGIYYWLVKETNATFPTTWTYVAPVIAMIVGALFLEEPLTVFNVLGGVCVLIGIILLNWHTWKEILNRRKNVDILPMSN